MLDLHGSLFALRALVRPGLIVPAIKVDTIARLDFVALKKAGYTGAVLDRDNCLVRTTIPLKPITQVVSRLYLTKIHLSQNLPQVCSPSHQTSIDSQDLQDAWTRCKSTFGPNNILVVSNSAGTSDDPLGIQAESLSFNLGVPVLRHSRKKPACGEEILAYFRRLERPPPPPPVSESHPGEPPLGRPNLNEPLDPDLVTPTRAPPHPTAPLVTPTLPSTPRLLIVGDRLMTDILLARTLSPSNHLGIWTTRLWSRPDLPVLRYIEQSLLRAVLWSRNQTFRDGVLEQRARGENWLGREGWVWKTRRWVLGAVRRVPVDPEPIPPRTNELAKFVIPVPPQVVLPPPLPSSRMGWAWYYSKIGGRYTARGVWIGLAWSALQVAKGAKRGWAWTVARIKEARAKRSQSSTPTVETKS